MAGVLRGFGMVWVVAMAAMRPITESEFQAQVIQLAKLRGWLVHHTRPARIKVRGVETYRTPIAGHAGFPDLVLARRGRVIYAELKAQAGQLREDQIRWRDAMSTPDRTEYAGWFVWRPSDWAQIERVLE
mgnify:FL=1